MNPDEQERYNKIKEAMREGVLIAVRKALTDIFAIPELDIDKVNNIYDIANSLLEMIDEQVGFPDTPDDEKD